jgi:hypothetical protein
VTFSGTEGTSPKERRVHTGADSDMAPHLMVSKPLPTKGADGRAGIRGNSVPEMPQIPESTSPVRRINFRSTGFLGIEGHGFMRLLKGPGVFEGYGL